MHRRNFIKGLLAVPVVVVAAKCLPEETGPVVIPLDYRATILEAEALKRPNVEYIYDGDWETTHCAQCAGMMGEQLTLKRWINSGMLPSSKGSMHKCEYMLIEV